MHVCLLGDGLISLTLAKALVNKKIKVSLYYENNNKVINYNRTIGVSSNNRDFFEKEVIKINKKLIWDIKKIEIYNNKNKKEKILNFQNSKKKLFSIIKNDDLYKLLNKNLKKNNIFKKIKIINKSFYKKIIINNDFDLIFNCDANNEISKKYFNNKILKDYKSTAHVAIINHNKINNIKAVQIFNTHGPFAFLPISQKQTSIVFSIKNKILKDSLKLTDSQFKKLIIQNNQYYKINSISKFDTFQLKSKIVRNYYFQNILAFGSLLHQIHPLAGQGFNMSLRDLKVFLDLLKNKQNLGLSIDHSIYKDFEYKIKHLNFLFAHGNDFIYEFFNHNNPYSKLFPNKIFKYLKKNNLFYKFAMKYADKGLVIE